MKTLGSDTMAPVFPEVLEALARANSGEAASYSHDELSKRMNGVFSSLFGKDAVVRWALGGTGANIVSMAACVQRYEGIVVSNVAHMVEHERGAVTQATGAQFITVASSDGKISVDDASEVIEAFCHPHSSRPAVLSLTQQTEVGTQYSVDEIAAFAELARAHGMYLHVDGARIANAVASLDVSVKTMLTDTGVDIVSFGGTKGGTMFGEAIVVLNDELKPNIAAVQLSSGQLSAKTRYIAAQFDAFLADDLWITRARNANDMAQLLAKQLRDLSGINVWPCEGNMVFAELPQKLCAAIAKAGGVTPYKYGTNVVRWVAAWDTTTADIDATAELVRSAI